MKKIKLSILLLMLSSLGVFAQQTSNFKYNAILRDATGQLLVSQDVTIDISILQGSETGLVVFSENTDITTTEHGGINIFVGSQNTTDFDKIDWSKGPYFLKIKVNGAELGTSQLMSVPYALHAKTVSNLTESDPIFDKSTAKTLTPTDIANWNTAFGWNDHSKAGYLTTYTETDPTVGVNTSNYISKWDGSALVSGTIYDDGDVGIGTATPGYKLDVSGDGNFTGNLTVGSYTLPTADGTNGQFLKTDGFGNITWVTAGGTGDLLAANNLSELTASATTARTNIGLGTIATQNANSVILSGGSIDGISIGTSVIAAGAFSSLNINNNYSFPTTDGLNGQVLQTDGSGLLTWQTAGGGEVNTGSNTGATGVGVYRGKTGANLEFYNVNSGTSNTITVTDDGANGEIDLDINQANITGVGTLTSGTWTANLITGSYLDLSSPGNIGTTTQATGSFSALQVGTSTTAGFVLTADASGNATWTASATADWLNPGTIGATTPNTGVFTTLKLQSGATVNEFSTDGTLVSNSDLKIPTEKAVSTFVSTSLTSLSGSLGSMAFQDANTIAVTGGAIDGTNIGATTQATGAFSTLQMGTSTTAGFVLTADASGNATWTASATADWANPGTIGATVPNSGIFTTLNINNAYNFPTADGTVGQILQTDGAGNTTWQAAGGVSAINDLSDAIDDGSNMFFGVGAGANLSATSGNLGVGHNALNTVNSGTNNTAFGFNALQNTDGTANVAIGYQAGMNELGNNKLYISNSSSATPLIYGEFDNDRLIFNGKTTVTGDANFEKALIVSITNDPHNTTGNYQLDVTEKQIVVFNNPNAFSIDNFQNGITGQLITIVNKGPNPVTVLNGATINLVGASYPIPHNGSAQFFFDGAVWMQIQ